MRFKSILLAAAAASLGWALAVGSASAGVIYSNYADGQSYNCCTGWAVFGPSSFEGFAVDEAMGFTAATGGNVSQIDIALQGFEGAGTGSVSLWTGDFSSQLGSWSYSSLPGSGGSLTISGITGVQLAAGASYVLYATASNDTFAVWGWNTTGATGPVYEASDNPIGVHTLGAFDVQSDTGSAVPEPATWAMMLVGFGGLGALLRRRRAMPATVNA
ncbi:MAG: choice-of-anchor family protein [Phenylobacterium sp.]|nr:choice-of-anchor family protein [Phenylobacterium sp.]